MTARLCFEGLLTELSKVNAPSMLLLDFNYFFNKAINQYINKRYNIYDVNLQTTDDLRVLKASTYLKVDTTNKIQSIGGHQVSNFMSGQSRLFGGMYYVNLPLDYLHMLNCVCVYLVKERHKCYNANDVVQFAAKRLTGDLWSVIINDFYNRPLPERPYYYINNVNTSNDLPTNPILDSDVLTRNFVGTDSANDYTNSSSSTVYVVKYIQEENELENNSFTDAFELNNFKKSNPNAIVTLTATIQTKASGLSNLPRTIDLSNFTNKSIVEREAGVRYGNSAGVRCEIRYGNDNSVFLLIGVLIDYIKSPQTIRLTLEQVNLTKDTSQIMEFPDYVCLEIINELVHLVMENTADPRLQTHNAVTQSIASPVQQLAQPAASLTGLAQ